MDKSFSPISNPQDPVAKCAENLIKEEQCDIPLGVLPRAEFLKKLKNYLENLKKFGYISEYQFKTIMKLVQPTALIFVTEPGKDAPPFDNTANNFVRRSLSNSDPGLNIEIIHVTRVSQIKDALLDNYNINYVIFVTHSDDSNIFVGQEHKPDTNISTLKKDTNVDPNTLDWSHLTNDAYLSVIGCNSGGRLEPNQKSIIFDLSKATNRPVSGSTNYILFFYFSGFPFIKFPLEGKWIIAYPDGTFKEVGNSLAFIPPLFPRFFDY